MSYPPGPNAPFPPNGPHGPNPPFAPYPNAGYGMPPQQTPPKKSRKGLWTGLTIGLVVVVGLVTAVIVTNSGGGDSPSAAGPQAVQGPPDRDPQALLAALRELDACALFDLNVAHARGLSQATTFPTGPHSCLMAADAGYDPAYVSSVEIKVGSDSDFGHRYNEKPVTIGGAKAYQQRQDSGSSSRGCELDIPVSHTRSITMNVTTDLVEDPNYDACQVVTQYAEGTIGKLANPDALTVDTSARPLSAWDGCTLLSKLLGGEASGYVLAPSGSTDPLSSCRALSKDAGGEGGPAIEARYDKWDPASSDPVIQLAGKNAVVDESGSKCFAEWDNGPTGVANEWFGSLTFKLEAKDCDTAKNLAQQAIQLATRQPDPITAQPQRPLLYGPDENDTGAVGACVDFTNAGSNAGCVPYEGGVTVPKSFEEAANAAESNQAVQCAAFQDAVRAAYGPELKPATWAAHCFFLEPTHTLVLRVNVDGTNAPSDYGQGSGYVDRQVRELAGKQTVSYWTEDRSQYDVYYSPYNDINREGNLHINVEAQPGRGDASTDRPVSVPLDETKAKLADQVIEQVAKTYFP